MTEIFYNRLSQHIAKIEQQYLDILHRKYFNMITFLTQIFGRCDLYPKSDVRSIGFEVLNFLEGIVWVEPIESLTTDNIPTILEFLNTSPDKSLEAWDKWEKYWTNLDYPARRKKLLENVEK